MGDEHLRHLGAAGSEAAPVFRMRNITSVIGIDKPALAEAAQYEMRSS